MPARGVGRQPRRPTAPTRTAAPRRPAAVTSGPRVPRAQAGRPRTRASGRRLAYVRRGRQPVEGADAGSERPGRAEAAAAGRRGRGGRRAAPVGRRPRVRPDRCQDCSRSGSRRPAADRAERRQVLARSSAKSAHGPCPGCCSDRGRPSAVSVSRPAAASGGPTGRAGHPHARIVEDGHRGEPAEQPVRRDPSAPSRRTAAPRRAQRPDARLEDQAAVGGLDRAQPTSRGRAAARSALATDASPVSRAPRLCSRTSRSSAGRGPSSHRGVQAVDVRGALELVGEVADAERRRLQLQRHAVGVREERASARGTRTRRPTRRRRRSRTSERTALRDARQHQLGDDEQRRGGRRRRARRASRPDEDPPACRRAAPRRTPWAAPARAAAAATSSTCPSSSIAAGHEHEAHERRVDRDRHRAAEAELLDRRHAGRRRRPRRPRP